MQQSFLLRNASVSGSCIIQRSAPQLPEFVLPPWQNLRLVDSCDIAPRPPVASLNNWRTPGVTLGASEPTDQAAEAAPEPFALLRSQVEKESDKCLTFRLTGLGFSCCWCNRSDANSVV